jgi:glycine oxidase
MDICVIGGGIAGLTVARACAALGASTTVLEKGELARGASHAAAGMLAPLVEARLEERDLVRFGYEALARYPEFIAALEEESGIDVGYRREGTLVVGLDRDDVEQVRHLHSEQQLLGLPVEWLSGYECRQLEPSLAPSIPGGIFSPHDHQVDNRRLLQALIRSCSERHGVEVHSGVGEGSFTESSGRRSYRTSTLEISADHFVLSTGADSDLLVAVEPALARSVRPVKGQIIRLDQSGFHLLDHVVRTPDVYLVPKGDGRLVVGASAEDRGFDRSITAGEIMELLRSAWEAVPGIYELPIVETIVGFRPATPDHMPMLGAIGDGSVSVATGYYRHGILFSPHAASLLANSLLGGIESPWLSTFSPSRFHEAYPERTTDRSN